MLRLVVFGMCLGLCWCQTYYTISSDLRKLFANNYDSRKSDWTSSTAYTSTGLPTYAVTCNGTPNKATSQTNTLTIASTKTVSTTSYCMPMGPIGYAVNGVAIFNAASADDEDAYTAEGSTFDGCGAHSQNNGIYHYHIVPGSTCPSTAGSDVCFSWNKVTEYTPSTGTTYLVGVALDGFPIFVTVNAGKVVAETGVDECGGKSYSYGGNTYYAYFLRPTFPYTLGCFKGTVVASSSASQGNLASCSSMGSNYICYCKQPATPLVKSCLPAKGAASCNPGQSVDCNISGECLSVKPSSGSTHRISTAAMIFVSLTCIMRLYF